MRSNWRENTPFSAEFEEFSLSLSLSHSLSLLLVLSLSFSLSSTLGKWMDCEYKNVEK
jgi:hypothetical protein